MNHRRWHLRRWLRRLLEVQCSPLFAALENVMDRRGRAAVTPRNSADRLTLRIPYRNGVPFALRDFRHLYSWLACQRPYHAPFQTPLLLAEMRMFRAENPPCSIIGERKLHKIDWLGFLTF